MNCASSPVDADIAVAVRVVRGVVDVLLEEPGQEVHRYLIGRDVGPVVKNFLIQSGMLCTGSVRRMSHWKWNYSRFGAALLCE